MSVARKKQGSGLLKNTQVMIRAARKELVEVERTSLTERDAHTFLQALTNPPRPNEALKKAFKDYKKQSKK